MSVSPKEYRTTGLLWEMTSGIIRVFCVLGSPVDTRSPMSLLSFLPNFTHFLREDGLSHLGTKLDHGLLAVGHGTVPPHAHRWHVLFVKLHCVPVSWWHCRFQGCCKRQLMQFFPRFHSTRLTCSSCHTVRTSTTAFLLLETTPMQALSVGRCRIVGFVGCGRSLAGLARRDRDH